LVRNCFDDSFGNATNAKKAIAKRGWNPLAYNLLNSNQLIRCHRQKEVCDIGNNIVALDAINTSNGTAGDYTDLIVEYTMLDKARMEGSRKKSQKIMTNCDTIDGLAQITNVTATTTEEIELRLGAFAAAGNFSFHEQHHVIARNKVEIKEKKISQQIKGKTIFKQNLLIHSKSQ
jgi:hypothetical protein